MRVIAQRRDIRDLILDGVDHLLAKYGYKKMTMEDLAQQVGIGKGTIYLHFPSKQGVTLSHIDRIVERLLVQLRWIAEGESAPEEKLKKMLITRVLFRFDSVRNYSQSLNDLLASLRGSLMSRRETHFAKEASVLEEVLQEGKKNGRFQFSDVNPVAQGFIWATNSLLPYSLTTRELGKRKEVEDKASRIADLLLHGIIQRGKN
ncbi:TetR/AcrR family transcriptional regulator [bacterium]|nr:TetR/AcrR family transcriptional regulator [bacterium]MCI0606882.1 TetR/AcrR family transcriptional regulator [bacterium]